MLKTKKLKNLTLVYSEEYRFPFGIIIEPKSGIVKRDSAVSFTKQQAQAIAKFLNDCLTKE